MSPAGLRKRWQTTGAPLVDALLEAVFPRRCALCSQHAPTVDGPLCPDCAASVDASTHAPACPRCGATIPPYTGEATTCPTCADQRFQFDSVARVGAYTGGLRALLTAFKFGGHEELDVYFIARLARTIARTAVYDDVDALVPVPTCWQHRISRRFHPATAMARPLARRTGIPHAPLLDRTGGAHQVGLSYTARQANVRGRFRLARGCAVEGACLLLVDDVMTTGATASECARVLKRAGAREVHVAVIARAGDDPVTLRHI